MIWTGERARQQRLLVAEVYQAAAGVPSERRAAIAGGLPGADKAAALVQAGLDQGRYLTVSIDAILDRMAAAGLIPEPGRRAGPQSPPPRRPTAGPRSSGPARSTPKPSTWPNGFCSAP